MSLKKDEDRVITVSARRGKQYFEYEVSYKKIKENMKKFDISLEEPKLELPIRKRKKKFLIIIKFRK